MSALNDLTNYEQPLQPNGIDIRTEYLEPITSSKLRHTFRLDQTGYLDTNSMFVFKYQAVGADQNNNCRLNCWNGALGSIKRVIFQIGDNIINDIQDVYKYATLKNTNMPCSVRNNFLGHYLGNSLWLDTQRSANDKPLGWFLDGSGATETNTYTENNYSYAGAVITDHRKSGTNFGNRANTSGDGAIINSGLISTDKSVNHQHGITLGMLIPALKGQKIPLFLFEKQRILLTIEFNTADVYANNIKASKIAYSGGTENAICSVGDIVPVDVRMVVDYLIMPTDIQNELTEKTRQEGGYKMEFYDVVNVEKNIVQGTNGQVQAVEHRIGQNNREVHNIIMWKDVSPLAQNDVGGNSRGGALMCGQGCLGYGKEEYNVNIDGRDEFDHKVYNPISQYNELSNALGSDFQVSRPQYVNDSTASASELTTLAGGLRGTMKPLALGLRNGEPLVVGGGRQMGNYPIIWKWQRECNNAVQFTNPRDDHPIKVNYFCELSRVANILSTDKGVSVQVSY